MDAFAENSAVHGWNLEQLVKGRPELCIQPDDALIAVNDNENSARFELEMANDEASFTFHRNILSKYSHDRGEAHEIGIDQFLRQCGMLSNQVYRD